MLEKKKLAREMPYPNSPAAKLLERFGGYTELARAAGVGMQSALRWNHQAGGYIPSKHWRTIIESGKTQGIEVTAADFVWLGED